MNIIKAFITHSIAIVTAWQFYAILIPNLILIYYSRKFNNKQI